MSLELDVPFETEEGHQYIVSFSEFHTGTNYGIPIIDISITLVSKNIEINSLATLNKFIEIILEYLKTNNVVFYFYCDTGEIKIRQNRKQKYSNQEYRFKLFTLLFNKVRSNNFYLQDIIINDPANGNHYIGLISRLSNSQKIELIKKDIRTLNK